ncbi:hypothetical protein ACS0TY_009017 [Phlomoides rotata]
MNILVRRTIMVFSIGLLILMLNKHRRQVSLRCRRFSVLDRIPTQIKNLSDLVDVSDEDCRDQLRMDRATFHKLCFMLQSMGGLKSSRRVTVTEKVAMFLSVLAHHTKNRCVKFHFKRSGQTVSKHFHAVLHCVLRMNSLFLVKPQVVTEDSTDVRWQKNSGCLGALDRTYVDVHVPTTDKGRYKNRKGQISINILGVCDMNMKFVYILTGWERSAAYSRVLRNAINRMCWGILCSPSWYPIKTVNKIIMTCCLLYNYIRKEMVVDPLELDLDEYMLNCPNIGEADDGIEIVDSLDTTPEWTTWRDSMSMNIMDQQGNLLGQHGDRVKIVRGRRSWSKVEEDALIQCLTNVVNEGWKAKNDFRAGF